MSSTQFLPESQRLSIPVTAASFESLGTAGTGFVGLKSQSSAPALPSDGLRLYTDGAYLQALLPSGNYAGFTFGDGTAALPSITFGADLDTGIYRAGANSMGFAAAGAAVVLINASGLNLTSGTTGAAYLPNAAGSVSNPAFSFVGNTDTGAYLIGANNYGIAVAGVAALDVAAAATKIGGQANGQLIAVETLTELTTIAAAATTSTAIQIPAGAVVFGVSARVTAAVTCTTTFTYGVSGATSRYGTAVSKALNTTNAGTDDSTRYYGAATSILITPDTTPSDATGRVRITIWFYRITPATS